MPFGLRVVLVVQQASFGGAFFGRNSAFQKWLGAETFPGAHKAPIKRSQQLLRGDFLRPFYTPLKEEFNFV